jgi:hypothetical protein
MRGLDVLTLVLLNGMRRVVANADLIDTGRIHFSPQLINSR